MINNRDHYELAMRYEGLACAVFECNRMDDPWHIASADPFDHNLVPQPNDKLRGMLKTVIDIAIWKHQGNDELVNDLLIFRTETNTMSTQDRAHEIVMGLIVLLEERAGY